MPARIKDNAACDAEGKPSSLNHQTALKSSLWRVMARVNQNYRIISISLSAKLRRMSKLGAAYIKHKQADVARIRARHSERLDR